MDLRSLECAVALAEEGHFGRAADRLNITQSALSQRISGLEKDVGHPLFTRTQGPVRPTEAGEALVRRARSAIENAISAKSEARLAATGFSGALKVGFTQIVLQDKLPGLLRAFREAYPEIRMEFEELISPKQERALESGMLDIGFVHPPLSTKGLELCLLREIRLMLVVPDDWPEAKLSGITLEQCSSLPFLIAPRNIGPVLYDGIIAACLNAGFSPDVVQEVSPMSALIGLASAGVGAGFVAECFAHLEYPGARLLPVIDPLPGLKVAVAWRRDSKNPAIQHFVELAVQFNGGRWPV